MKTILIVLGNPPHPDGSLTRILQSRLDLAIALYRNSNADKIILTGGAVYNHYVEAEIMEKYCLEQEVDATDILVESLSRDTYDNALYSSPIVNSQNSDAVIVITSHFHWLRTKIIFQHYFNQFKVLTPPFAFADLISYFHIYIWEIYLAMKLLVRGDERLARKPISPQEEELSIPTLRANRHPC